MHRLIEDRRSSHLRVSRLREDSVGTISSHDIRKRWKKRRIVSL